MKTTTKPHTAPAHVLRPSVTKTPKLQVAVDLFKRRQANLIAQASQGRAAPRLIASSSYTPGGYTGAELKPYTGRPDTAQALALPSRSSNRLRYPDGRITDMAGNLLDESRSTT